MRILVFILLLSFGVKAQNYQALIQQHREEYKADFISNEHSPLNKKDLKHLRFYEADSAYKVMANLEILQDEKPFKIPTYAGTTANYIRYAKASFVLKGQPLTMTLYKNIALANHSTYSDYLFIPFTDQTNGKETYGGGRYLDLRISNITDHKIEIDFNKAYNPYCAYSDGYRCPIPPEENHLSFNITAGEKNYMGEKKRK